MVGKRVAIIGSGVSGLPSARWALAYGWEPVLFEQDSEIGGLWTYKDATDESKGASVMKGTVINTPKEMIAYSDFPFPPDTPNFMHNSKMAAYLRAYSDAHGITKHVRFNHRVVNVRRADDHASTGRWIVDFHDSTNTKCSEVFEAVLSCVGHHSKPHTPNWPGMDAFRGTLLHSKAYREPSAFEDKRVLVIGAGNSGIDVACEVSRVARQTYLSTRGGVWVMPRSLPSGRPTSMWLSSRWHAYVRRWLPSAIWSWMLESLLQRALDHDAYGLRPRGDPISEHFSISDELRIRLSTGQVRIRPAVERFTSEGVMFVGDDKPTPLDAVVLATGYNFEFPFLDEGRLVAVRDNHVRLYKGMWPTEGAPRNTLALIGLVYPVGPVPPIAEMQARLFFASAASSPPTLPTRSEMDADIDRRLGELDRARAGAEHRHNISVDYVEYMSELGEMIGVTPRPLDYLLSDPLLAYRLVFGPEVACSYRLRGPHALPSARDAILGVERRALAGLRGGGKKSAFSSSSSDNALSALFASNMSVVNVVFLFLSIGYFLLLNGGGAQIVRF